ncbi:MAG: hypothetical protein A2X13_13635 [Bacteroidetes bacterium GWC2_33_15]|nr:MAG: hypothetical protein A2X10_08850 [Bacteroidetes bacterium GWA2_33_15]OFX50389.1 MAG: hypothetical protein A2X13_13635 [Bacteroidetes bacterium GWC2_33_15]OFX66693.1 MAG: hypothetical protein A2X15_08240 [Bacteroidetes bacterium GWB2_32_14]OFX69311.1 MAG: hypothetical protein A2X14_09170 [Bacteroidetes bacterium GWD2_33_33]HAN18627.1 hypothetical protein [Bacteroidales bacterium]
MSFEITGKLVEKYNTVQVSDRFKKREFVIEAKESNGGLDFKDFIKFQLTQDKCNLIEQLNMNDEIKVSFNIRGNKWEKEGKVNYFTNLDAWRIEKVQNQNQRRNDDMPPLPTMDDVPPENEPDDLPF